MSANRLRFVNMCYKVMDILTEVKALLEEYDDGLPIVKNTSLIHKEIDSMKGLLRNIMVNYHSDSSEEVSDDDDMSEE